MITIVKGNLLDAKEDIIAHQVNVYGIMGAGVAYQIANKYPKVNELYKQQCELQEDKKRLIGTLYVCEEHNKKIANLFSQNTIADRYGNLTNYEALDKCFSRLNLMGLSVAIPYKIGCGIAGGDWDKVMDIIIDNCVDIDVTIYKL